ncbi:lipoate--protein ligase, partial [Lactobacillus parabuchneri]|nr:lipoate--protein ligase [Lentilactobacillus parabuchneri]
MDDFREYLLKEIFAVKSLDDIETYHMTDQDWETADKRLAETYGTDAWNFGHNPGYYDYADQEFSEGKLGINWTIDDGKLVHLKFNPFFKVNGDLSAIEAALSGKKPSGWNVKRAVKKANIENIDTNALTEFLMGNFDKTE